MPGEETGGIGNVGGDGCPVEWPSEHFDLFGPDAAIGVLLVAEFFSILSISGANPRFYADTQDGELPDDVFHFLDQ